MAEGGFEDFEMEDLGRNYLQYNNMNEQQLNDEYDNLTRISRNLLIYPDAPEDRVEEIRERIDYIDSILENRKRETTFTDGKTAVTRKRKGDILDLLGATIKRPKTELKIESELTDELLENPENEKKFAIENFIRKKYKDENFILDQRK